MRWRSVTCGALGLVLLVGAAGATGELSRASKANRAEARSDAARQLAALSLPAGATPLGSQHARSVLRPFVYGCRSSAYLSVMSDRRFWRVSEDPSRVISWVRAHAPPGSQVDSSGQTMTRSGAPVSYITFGFGPDPGRVFGRCLGVVVLGTAHGADSAVGVVSQATWVQTRPKWDKVPRSVHVITARFVVPGGRASSVTFSSPRSVERVARLINRAVVIQPAVSACKLGRYEMFALVFRARPGGAVIARARVWPTGCSYLTLAVRGRSGPLLTGAVPLTSMLLALGAVPACQPDDIALGRASFVRGSGMYADFAIRDVGMVPCQVTVRPTVSLLGPKQQPLATPISHSTLGLPWVIASGLPVDMFLSWSHSCKRNAARKVQVSLPGLPRPLTAPIGSKRHPADPCRAQLQFRPLSLL